MSYNGTQIVEVLLDSGIWYKVLLSDWYEFYEKELKYDNDRMRVIEGSLDEGVTWKVRYDCELVRINKCVGDFIWREQNATYVN